MLILPRVLFIVVGVINVTPLAGVLGAPQLESLYGRQVEDADMLLLLRHRAVLFGLLGALLMSAAFWREVRSAATAAGVVSMVSFCLLAFPPGAHGAALQRVFWADVIATPLLLAAWWLSRGAERGGR